MNLLKPFWSFIKSYSSNIQFFLTLYLLINIGILSFPQPVNASVAMPITEDFEANAIGDMSFSEPGVNFNATGGLEINEFPGFTKYMERYLSSDNGGSVGSFAITTSNTAFRVESLDIWPSTMAASIYMALPVKFIGTPSAGGSPIEVELTPTGGTNNSYGSINFTGTALDGIDILSLEFVLPTGLGYLAIDNFEFLTSSTLNAAFSISSESSLEGDAGSTTMSFTVTKSAGPAAESITVQTANVSALAGSDYQAAGPTTLSFGTPASSQSFDVLINGDTEFENDEMFHAILSNPTGTGVIVTGTGIGTIIDDDLICEDFEDNTIGDMTFSENGIGFNAAPFSVSTFMNFTQYMKVSATGNVGSFARTSNDPAFSAISIDVWMGVSSTSTSASAGMLTVTGTPSDGGTSIIEVFNVAQPMGGSPTFPYTRVSFDGTQLATTALNSLAFTLDAGLGYIAIDNFKFIEVVGSVTNVSIANASTIEGDIGTNQLDFVITRSDNLSAFNVNFNTILGTAMPGSDYTDLSTTVSFTANGDLTKSVIVDVLGDIIIENTESMTASLSNATNGISINSGNATGSIFDDDKICEEFELDGPHGAISFEEFGSSFGLTDQLIIGFFENNGATGSDYFIETDTNFLPHSGNVGSIILNNGCSFMVKQLDLYISTNSNINNANIGAVKFIGNLDGGGTASVDLMTTTINNWTANLSFAGTALENQSLLSLEIELPDSVRYVAVDNFKFVHEHLSPQVGMVNVPTCGGAADGSFEITGLEANTIYSIQYEEGGTTTGPQNVMTNGSGSFTISNLSAGIYTNMIVSSVGPMPCMTPAFDIFLVQPNLLDSDGDGTPDCADGCPTDPNKTGPGTCGCSNPEPGTPCDDGNSCTLNDVIGPGCNCIGTPLSDTTKFVTITCDPNQVGSDTIKLQNQSGCDSLIITTTNLESAPTEANAGPDQFVCSDSTQLAGNTAVVGTGVWNILVGSAVFANSSDPTSKVTGMSPGDHVFEWVISNGVCPPSRDTVKINRDNSPPVAICKNIIVYLDAAGTITISGADIDNGSTDPDCGIDSLIAVPNSFTCTDTGTNLVVLYAYSNGLNDTCHAYVNVRDTSPPQAICLNLTLVLDNTGNGMITADEINNNSTDNCGIISYTASKTSFTCADTGVNKVILTVTDGSSNIDTCTALITVIDGTAPTALCMDLTVYLDESGNVSITGSDVDNGSFDECGLDTLMVSPNTFTCANIGVNNVIMTVIDLQGNTGVCNATVNVVDTIPPKIECAQDQTVSTSDDGLDLYDCMYTVVSTEFDPVDSDDNCSVDTIWNDYTNTNSLEGANFPVGTTSVLWTILDDEGNSATCSLNITVMDDEEPMASCVNSIDFSLNQFGQITIPQLDIESIINTASFDNCMEPLTFTLSQTFFDCSHIGQNLTMLTVTDKAGNSSSCGISVNIQDTTAPECLTQNITVYLDAQGNASITVADIDGGFSDACGIDTFTVSPNSFTCANIGANTVTLTLTDVNGNTNQCTTTVNVEDTIPPTPVCQNITVYLNEFGNALIQGEDVDDGSSDNCAIATLSVIPNNFNCADTGANNVELMVTDVYGNDSLCKAIVTVIDTTPPTPLCQDITVYLDISGNTSIIASELDGGSMDNCQVDSFHASQTEFSCIDLGIKSIIFKVIDGSGNEATCPSNVTVVDTILPIAMCQNITVNLNLEGTVTITPEMIDNGSSDNCAIQSLTLDKTLFTCSDTGANTVILTVTDQSGNSNTCSAIVTVGGIMVSQQNIVGMTPFCPGLQGVPYSTIEDPAVLSYEWSYSGNGATINNNGEPNITIDFSANATSGTLSINYISACGLGEIVSSFPITRASAFSCTLATNCLTDNLFVINAMIGFNGNVNLFKARVGVGSIATIEKDQTVLFRAGQEINLYPFFEVEKGALFLAEIEGCFDNLKTEEIRKKE